MKVDDDSEQKNWKYNSNIQVLTCNLLVSPAKPMFFSPHSHIRTLTFVMFAKLHVTYCLVSCLQFLHPHAMGDRFQVLVFLIHATVVCKSRCLV